MSTTNVLNVGIASLEQYKARTMAIARGEYVPGPDEPKVWFQSLETPAQVLSDRNRSLLALIAETKPASLSELAECSGRAKSNLSRTLRTKPWSDTGSFTSKKARVEKSRRASSTPAWNWKCHLDDAGRLTLD
jgi:predicted transcriptional regulator